MSGGNKRWLVAVPGDPTGGTGRKAIQRIIHRMDDCTHAKGTKLADLYYFRVPELKVGALDTLMSLSDDLVRIDAFIEGVVRKVERQFVESGPARQAAGSLDGESKTAGGGLTVNRLSVADYLKKFRWNHDEYDMSDETPVQLVKRFQSMVDDADRDVRSYIAAYNERKAALATLHRKKGGNLMVASMDTIITPEVVDQGFFEDSTFLTTEAVVFPKQLEEQFLATYETLDADSVPVGPEDNRESVRASPVVPQSAFRVTEDKDGYVLYTVVVLRKFIDSFRNAARELRYNVREIKYDPATAGSASKQIADAEVEATKTLAHLRRQCQLKFSEVFAIWIHIKAIRVFAESVLRFGVPINFVCAIITPYKGTEARLHKRLQDEFAEEGTEDDKDDFGFGTFDGGAAGGLDAADFYPYVFFDFDVSGLAS